MSHPFTRPRRSLIIYSLVILVLVAINFAVLYFNMGMSVVISLAEAFTTSLVYGLLGLIIWYPIRYIPFRKEAILNSIVAHVMAGILVILIWLLVTVGILSALFTDEVYQQYLSSSLGMRSFVGIIIYLLLVLVYYLISYAQRLKERAQAEEKLKTLVRESELNILKSQINPHFLFNSLNSISSLILSNPEEAREMTIRLSDFLRYSLKHRENEYVTLKEEIGRMEDYLAIERVRFGDKLKYDLKIGKECKEIEVPTMILQPLVENAIKHGVYESLEPVTIDFACVLKDHFLQLELVNDFDPEAPVKRGTGVGLSNVSERLRLAYNGKGIIQTMKRDNLFKVVLKIPVDHEEN